MQRYSSKDFVISQEISQSHSVRVAISKRVAKTAVDRNRNKRLIREALRDLEFKGKIKIIVKNNLADLKEQEIRGKLQKLIQNDKTYS